MSVVSTPLLANSKAKSRPLSLKKYLKKYQRENLGALSATITSNFLFFAATFKNANTVFDPPYVIMISLVIND
jgi:hypothetical protein